jgi:hypothetical protein
MNFSCCVVEKGPGLWVLNNTVLSNEIYVKRVKEIIADSVYCEMYDNYFSRFRKYFVFLSPSVAQMALDLNIAPLLCSISYLLSSSFQFSNLVTSITITSLSDHTYVFMNFSCCVVEKGPGLWVLNNTVLSNEIYVKRVKEIIADSVNCVLF